MALVSRMCWWMVSFHCRLLTRAFVCLSMGQMSKGQVSLPFLETDRARDRKAESPIKVASKPQPRSTRPTLAAPAPSL
jgi:hypothetical protein